MPKNPNDDDDVHVRDDESRPTEDEGPDQFEAVESVEDIDSEQWVQINQAYYDRSGSQELVTSLVLAVAEAKNVDPLDHDAMPPLYESVDAQALEETFFGPSGKDTDREQAGAVTFMYEGLKIALREDGWIFVYEPRESRREQ